MCAYLIKSYRENPKYNISNRSAKPKYISIHYTDGTGSAHNNVIYFRTGNRNSSADFFIDSKDIWRFNPNVAKYYTWAIGDGHGKYGYTNANTIHIEVVGTGKKFTEAEKKRLRYLVKLMMNKYGITKNNVIRHYDASRKLCPMPYCGSAKNDKNWKALHSYITK